jgi:hypothetical protein
MLKQALLAVTVAATISPSLAGAIDAGTPCAVAVQAFDSDKHAGQVLAGAPSREVLEVGNYIMKVMEDLDRQHTDAGKPGVGPNFSDAGKHASAVANCRLHPDRTIYQAADSVVPQPARHPHPVGYHQIALAPSSSLCAADALAPSFTNSPPARFHRALPPRK